MAIKLNDLIQILQMWIIFTHLKLCVATAKHNFKCVEIEILYLSGQRVKTRVIVPVLNVVQCWPSVCETGPILNH